MSNNHQLNLLSSRDRDLVSVGPADLTDLSNKLVIHDFLKSKDHDSKDGKSHSIQRLYEIIIQLKNEDKAELSNSYRIELLRLMDQLHLEKHAILQ